MELSDDELTVIGRNNGVARPRGVNDTIFRALLKAMIAIEAQTIYSLEQILDILFPGAYTLYEDLESYVHTVFIEIQSQTTTVAEGKTWLVGGELQTRTDATHVDSTYAAEDVYGVYDDGDPFRAGTNYANAVVACTTDAGDPDVLSSGALWEVADVGKPVHITTIGEHWRIVERLNANDIRLEGKEADDGSTLFSAPTTFTTTNLWFAKWVVGHRLEILDGDNAGIYTIAARPNARTLTLSGAAFVSSANVAWRLLPTFGTQAGLSAEIMRATSSGLTITTPQSMPAGDVLVDYTTVPSAQALKDVTVVSRLQSAFYLNDEQALMQTLGDLLTAAGVRVVMETV